MPLDTSQQLTTVNSKIRKADKNKPAFTMYPNARRTVEDCTTGVLKVSRNKKISKDKLPMIRKGEFAGYVIFTLTLEERATCPRTCYHWDDCYGNNMAFAHRFPAGKALEDAIEREIAEHCAIYKGVIVRLHVLGDFYSVDYVKHWQDLLSRHDNLAVWGYTGYAPNSDIGLAIRAVRGGFGTRFSVRFSNAPDEVFSANSTEVAEEESGKSAVCPEQTGKAESCATCTFCWSAQTRQVLFLTH